MKKIYSLLILSCLVCLAPLAFAQTVTTFNYTGSMQTYVVPQCVTTIYLDLWGAPGGKGGGSASYIDLGGAGGRVQCAMAVTAGQVLNIFVGGTGASTFGTCCTAASVAGGYNGGGAGYGYYCGGGGGETDIRVGGTAISNRVVVAGGGGGGSYYSGPSATGGAGGGTTGGNGLSSANSGTYSSSYCGSGGGQSSGGSYGSALSQPTGTGTQGQGGSSSSGGSYSAGGGGGYWGGGCGSYYGGGGGGSSYPASAGGSITSVTHTQGFNSSLAGGRVIISTSAPAVFNYTGSAQTYTVPANVTSLAIDAVGANGGSGGYSSSSSYPMGYGGRGGRINCNLAVSPGQVLTLYVGGVGGSNVFACCTNPTGGYNGGGAGYYGYNGGGGGGTDIRTGAAALADRVIVAGGGGGPGAAYSGGYGNMGGDGGDVTGGNGIVSGSYQACYCGQGGSQSAGGLTGTCYSSYTTQNGTLGIGGTSTTSSYYSGGGGGGYYGGASGGYYGSGGGGSSYTGQGTSAVVNTQGGNGYVQPSGSYSGTAYAGNGYITITPLTPSITSSPGTLAFGYVTTGTTSAPLTFVAAASSMQPGGTLTLTPPANYDISPDGIVWYNSSTPYAYIYPSSDFTLIMFARLTPPGASTYNGNIAITGGGLPCTANIAVTGAGAAACSGSPSAGTATINGGSSASGNSATQLTLSVTPVTSGGITYQWQISTTSSSSGFTNISGANTSTYLYSGLPANAWFKCVVSCGGSSSTSSVVSATFTLPGSSCTPTYQYSCNSYPMNSSIASLSGASGSISDPSNTGTASTSCNAGYADNSGSMSVTLNPGTNYNATLNVGGPPNSYWSSMSDQIWIDFNDDGVMSPSETVGGFAQGGASSNSPVVVLAIPANARPGAHRMRLEGIYNPTGYGFTNYPNMTGCPTSSIYYGNTRDYTVIISGSITASVTATPVSNFGSVTTNTSSVPVAVTKVTGSGLAPSIGFVTVTAPSYPTFKVSLDGVTWGNSVLLGYAGGAINGTNVYVQFNPTVVTSYSGNVTITGGGLTTTVNVAVAGNGQTACSGSPTAGTASVSPTSGGPAQLFTLSLSGVSSAGSLKYQWQSSPNSSTWTNITGAMTPTYQTIGISANTYFRCVVTCPSGSASNSSAVMATYQSLATLGCTPSFSYGTCSSYPMNTSIGSLSGASGTSIQDPSNFGASVASCSANFIDNSSTMSVNMNTGTSYTATLNVGSPPNNYYSSFSVQIWIDFNDDGTFASGETVGGIAQGSVSSATPNCTITIPSGATPGTHRMRILGMYAPTSYGYSAYPSLGACTAYSGYGNSRDYKVSIGSGGSGPVGPCSGTPAAGIVSPSQISSCSAFSPSLFNVGEDIAFSGISYQWQSSSSISSGFTNISGATGQGYIPTLSSVGTTYYRQTVKCATGGTNATSAVGLTFLAPPANITGNTSICNGQSSTLSDATAGGLWSSSASGTASIGSATGVTSGNSVGSATITYTAPSGCITTTGVTILAQPTAISGTNVVCGGTGPTTSTLTDATTGGVWSSGSIGIATIGASSGVATGVSSGSVLITYTNPSTGCFVTYPITVNAVPDISGTSSICVGYSVTLSDPGASGGTWSSTTPSVATIGASSGVLTTASVGATTISYTVSSIGCSAVRVENVTNVPNVYTVTGGGNFCSGGTGVHVGLSNSDAGILYQLYNGASTVGAPVTGIGGSIDFGLVTGGGTYNVIANPGTPCSTVMSGGATVTVNPLPTVYSVSGGGNYCSGGSGVHVYLSSSQIGVNYQVYLGLSPVGGPVAGTSAAIDFGLFTAAGTYTIKGTNTTTSCLNTMSGSATIGISPLPTPFTVNGGGGYCAGGTGVHVGLSNSVAGTNYQLMLGSTSIGAPVAGTGGLIDFGLFTTAGAYTVIATNTATSCSTSMTGSGTVIVNPLPTAFAVIGGGNYCVGGAGSPVGLAGSAAGVNYQLFVTVSSTTTAVGTPVAGTGSAISFGNQTTAGTYSVVATNATTGCVNNMTGTVTIATNPLPTSFNVTGGGGYCVGGTGVPVGLNGSAAGTTYQLFNGTTLVGAGAGTGGAISFGLQAAAGTNYNVVGTTAFGCTASMSGSVSVTINSLPNVFSVTGGGNYCAGGSGVAVGLSSSTSGVNYQLFNGATPVGSASAGSGSALNFGSQPLAGSYTVVAYNPTTTCSSNMSGSVTIGVNPTPVVYAVTGGGTLCAGSTGVHVGLASSDAGIRYQLFNTGTASGSPFAGSGAALDFGIQTNNGTYTIVATNTGTTCSSTMGGSAAVIVNTLPAVFAVNGGGNYCSGSAGMPIGLSASAAGINYQLYLGTTAVGSTVPGTGSAISFGLQTSAGTYNALAINPATGCANNMSGTASISVLPLPSLFAVSGGANYCAGGTGVHVNLTGSSAGISYQLMNGTAPAGLPMGGTGAALDFGAQTAGGTYSVVASNPLTTCSRTMTGTATIGVNPLPAPFNVTGGGDYCIGGSGKHVGLANSATGMNYQLYAGGAPTGIPLAGTGFPLDFGLQAAAGSYQVVATDATTTCTNVMTGTTSIVVDPLPVLHTVTGGGNYCIGASGVNVALDNSNTGTSYQLYNGSVAVGSAMPGLTGAPINFGQQTGTGSYSVMAATTATGCNALMLGSVPVGTYPLPVTYNVTGGGNYCVGGSGVHVGLSSSNTGILYQLYNGTSPVGGFVSGTGSSLDFGMLGSTGTYTVIASNASTSCSNTMNGNATVGVSTLPASHLVNGGGNYCAGGTGVSIGLNGSNTGTAYQLYNGATPVGSPFAGTGLGIDFGLQTAAGTYTVIGMNTTTCTNTMTGSATIGVDPLPAAYVVSGGGNFCSGTTGVDISLNGSDVGTNYQLYNGAAPVGAPLIGTGFALDFGMQAAPGTYFVAATNGTTSCTNNMTGSVIISVNPLPTAFTVGGGGNYCVGGSGVPVTLAGSSLGATYQLYNSGVPVGSPMSGTGGSLSFGSQTAAGSYSVVATNTSTTCTGSMTGSATVTVKPLPNVYAVTSTANNYCAGTGGVGIMLAGSDAGVNYQLYNGATAMGTGVSGTGAAVDFGYWLAAGSYTVAATNTSSGCMNNMSGAANIVVNPLPAVYNVTGGGTYCSGSAGVHVGINSSTSGTMYQLMKNGVATGSAVAGSGSGVDFGLQSAAGVYSVVAANPATTCTSNMTGSATIAVSPLPSTFAVTGGGNYCVGGAGADVGLSGSVTGVNYQLYKGGTLIGGAMGGSGSSIDFGLQTAIGSYTVLATNSATGCSNTMAGSAAVGLNAAPTAYTVTGGGSFCPGGTGVHVSINNTTAGINYQLYNGTIAVGSTFAGTGAGVDFGTETTPGIYTVAATNATTGCSANMTGHASVVLNTTPAAFNITGGGNYCAGGAGVHIGLASTNTGTNYTLYSTSSTVRTLSGTGGPLDFGFQTGASTYTVIGTDATTGCSANMTGSVAITVTPIVTPFISVSTGVGDSICEGSFITFTANALNGGTSPTYQWNVNGAPAGVGNTYGYAPADGDVISVTLTSSATCATPSSVSSAVTMKVDPMQSPAVSAAANPGNVVCQGTSVTFTAIPAYGGTAPTYTWMKNGGIAGSSPTFSYVPTNGDVVYCLLGSNYHCRLADNATSSHINMEVDLPTVPSVSVSAYPGLNIAAGQAVTFTAAVSAGGGPNPSYQWLINSVVIPGATQSTYVSSNLFDGDAVTCHVLSSGGCAGILGSGNAVVHIVGTGVAQIGTAGADIRLLPNPNKGQFTIKGTLGTTSADEVAVEITDMLGQVIYNAKVPVHNGEIDQRITLSNNFANGMYILNLRTGSENKVFHFVLEQ